MRPDSRTDRVLTRGTWNISYTAKEAFEGATICGRCISTHECQNFSVCFHVELLSPDSPCWWINSSKKQPITDHWDLTEGKTDFIRLDIRAASLCFWIESFGFLFWLHYDLLFECMTDITVTEKPQRVLWVFCSERLWVSTSLQTTLGFWLHVCCFLRRQSEPRKERKESLLSWSLWVLTHAFMDYVFIDWIPCEIGASAAYFKLCAKSFLGNAYWRTSWTWGTCCE